MHDWFYSTLAAGILFIASLEGMVLAFGYIFFVLGVEGDSSSTHATPSGGGTGTDARAKRAKGTVAYASAPTVTRGVSSHRSPQGRGLSTSRPSGSSRSNTAAPEARDVAEDTRGARDTGLRRRRPAGLPVSASEGHTAGASASLPRSRQHPTAGVDPQDRGVMVKLPPAASDSRIVAGASSVMDAGADAGRVVDLSVAAGSSVEAAPTAASREARDAAAMAAWTALGGNEEAQDVQGARAVVSTDPLEARSTWEMSGITTSSRAVVVDDHVALRGSGMQHEDEGDQGGGGGEGVASEGASPTAEEVAVDRR